MAKIRGMPGYGLIASGALFLDFSALAFVGGAAKMARLESWPF